MTPRPRFLPLAVYAIGAANLLTLWIARGSFVGGWDTAGATFAVLALNGGGAADGLRKLTDAVLNQRRPVFTGGESFIYGLIPGLLNGLVPWVLWGNLLSLVLFLAVSLWITRRLRIRRHIYFACVLASPAIVSCSIVAYPWLTSTAMTYALAIGWVLSERQPRRAVWWGALLDVVVFATIAAIAFNGYEAGKTMFVVPAVAALTVRGLPLGRRIVWLAAAAAVAWVVFEQASGATGGALSSIPRDPVLFAGGVLRFVRAYANGWEIDYPGLALAAVLVLFSLRSARLFWTALFGAVLGLVSLNAFQFGGGFLTPHRFLLLAFVSALVVSVALSEAPRWTPALAAASLLVTAGIVYTSYHTVRFALLYRPAILQTANPNGERVYPLPYHRAKLDQHIWPARIRDALRLVELARRTPEPHLLFYGFSIVGEDSVNPQYFPSRVILALGYPTFRERITFVDHFSMMFFDLPIRRLPETPSIAQRLPTPFFVHVREPEYSAAAVLAKYFNRARVVPIDLGLTDFKSFRVEAFAPPGPIPIQGYQEPAGPTRATVEGYCLTEIDTGDVALELAHKGQTFAQRLEYVLAANQDHVEKRFLTSAALDVNRGAFTVLEAQFDNPSSKPLPVHLRVRGDDEFAIVLNDQIVLEVFAWRSSSEHAEDVLLPPGPNLLRVVHHQFWQGGKMALSSVDGDGRPIPWRCDPDFGRAPAA